MTRVGHAGLGYRLLIFAGAIVLIAGLYAVFNQPATQTLSLMNDTAGSTSAQTSHKWLSQLWTFVPFFAGVLAVLGLLIGATVERGP